MNKALWTARNPPRQKALSLRSRLVSGCTCRGVAHLDSAWSSLRQGPMPWKGVCHQRALGTREKVLSLRGQTES